MSQRQPKRLSSQMAAVKSDQPPTRVGARARLLDAARGLFASRDYRGTTTREIADTADVTEYLVFRHFGSKAGLFREALVRPFTDFVDDFACTWPSVVADQTDEEDLARQFVGQLYDLLVAHRGLVMTLVASENLTKQEADACGIADIQKALTLLGEISADGMRQRGMRSRQPTLPAQSTVAMIFGMVALRPSFGGAHGPSRDAVVEELVQTILHGFLHRQH